MSIIIDRRDTYKHRSSGSRQRFIKRYKQNIKDGIDKALNDSKGITDILGGSKKGIKVRQKGLDEPIFDHGEGGEVERIFSGNDEYELGDLVPKPQQGGGGRGRNGSPDGEGQDDFEFVMSREEFLNVLFEDLELPDLVKKNLLSAQVRELVHDGFTKSGPPGQLDVKRSFKNSLGRRIGLNRKPVKEELQRLEAERVVALDRYAKLHESLIPTSEEAAVETESFGGMETHGGLRVISAEIEAIEARIEKLKRKLKAIPFIDEIDLRFRHKDWESKPTVSAVMFALMDVSGSMGSHEKTIAKLFYFLLFLFLKRNYTHVKVIFIRHTHEAKEVDEQEFFYGRESGGTVVSTALELCYEIIKERFDPSVWNIYVAQASDGDNWEDDSEKCADLLTNKLLPLIQYMVYVQIDHDWSDLVYRRGMNPEDPQNPLWVLYEKIKASHPNMDMRVIGDKPDIYPVFRKLFEKKA